MREGGRGYPSQPHVYGNDKWTKNDLERISTNERMELFCVTVCAGGHGSMFISNIDGEERESWLFTLAEKEEAATDDGGLTGAREIPRGRDAAKEDEPVEERAPEVLFAGHGIHPVYWIRGQARGCV